jgi:hypothetical protein
MKTSNLFTIIVAALFFAVIYPAMSAEVKDPGPPETKLKLPPLSLEVLGAYRSVNLGDRDQYGAGLDLGIKFNNFVSGHIRALAYSDNHWRGTVVDEGSALIEAKLLGSANGRLTLSAIGGADRDFAADDWGFSVGPRISIVLTKYLSIVGESRLRAWFDQEKDLITTAGLKFSF